MVKKNGKYYKIINKANRKDLRRHFFLEKAINLIWIRIKIIRGKNFDKKRGMRNLLLLIILKESNYI